MMYFLSNKLTPSFLHFPRNLKRALELANVVADSRYNLYEDFMNEEGGRTLGEYLKAIRQAILAGLETEKSSDPFAIITHHPNTWSIWVFICNFVKLRFVLVDLCFTFTFSNFLYLIGMINFSSAHVLFFHINSCYWGRPHADLTKYRR